MTNGTNFVISRGRCRDYKKDNPCVWDEERKCGMTACPTTLTVYTSEARERYIRA